MSTNLWNLCMLEGDALNNKVRELELDFHGSCLDGSYWRNWALGGPIIERDHIFLQPPSEEHHNGGRTPGWNSYPFWRATVSSNTRMRPNPSSSPLASMTVGRGAGPTALIAAMRAYVDSHSKEPS